MSRSSYRGIGGCASIFAAALAGLIAMFAATAAHATDYTVGTLNDDNADLKCSLRDAINAANGIPTTGSGCTNDAGNGTASAPDTITFSVTGVIRLTIGTLPTITDNNLTINGPTTSPGITIDGNMMYHVLVVGASTPGPTLNLNNLTIAQGTGGSDVGGGGILISVATEVNVTNCTFSGNNAGTGKGWGGAISLGATGTLNVSNSTFSSNSAMVGGAIFNLGSETGGELTVTSSTIFGNIANSSNGGGIANGGGGTTTIVQNTILAANTGGDCGFGGIDDNGYNLADDSTCKLHTSTTTTTGTSQIVATSAAVGLAASTPANNGGPTETFALQSGSPAIGAIPVADCTYLAGPNPCTTTGSDDQLTCDQRGEPRPGSGETNCDIGAFEVQLATPFAAFQVALAIDLPDNFLVAGSFTPAASAPAINPTTQVVTLTFSSKGLIEPESVTIPAGSFKKVFGQYEFSGKVGDVDVSALITSPSKNTYGYVVAATGLELSGTMNPVTVMLTVGSNTGTANVKALIL